jgi:putative CocE/NonD family hydrolase
MREVVSMAPQGSSRIQVEFDVPATMRDGVVLRANVYRPDDGGSGRYPVLLSRLPYGKDLPMGSSALDPVQAARRGYIVVVQDVRGRFTSDGEWFPLINEGPDGAETVAWAASLPGSSGAVAMYGGSYHGFTQWAAAAHGAPALRAIAPMITWDVPDNGVVSRNGVFELGTQGSWNVQMTLDQIVRRHRGDVRAMGLGLSNMAREFDALVEAGYAELPIERFGPLARLGSEAPFTYYVEHADDPQAQESAGVAHAYDQIDIPALHIGGWYDVFLNGTLGNFTQLRSRGRQHQRLLIGPWTHGNVSHVQGDLDFGFGSSGYLVDLQADLMTFQLQFFDFWLKDSPNGLDAMPPVKYFLMGANMWKVAQTWPPEGVVEQRWYLESQGHANGRSGDGRLSPQPPAVDACDAYEYDPARPVPTIGGATLLHPALRAGPRDQRPIEQRGDVLVYTSEPLEAPLEVTGPVRVILHVATDAPDTDFVARLVDVYPDGRAITVTDGIVRMRYRNGRYAAAEPLDPGQVYRIEVDLWATALVFLPGHRVRLDVTSSSFPRWERNLNTGEHNSRSTEMRVAQQTVLHGSAHPSHLILSVLPR